MRNNNYFLRNIIKSSQSHYYSFSTIPESLSLFGPSITKTSWINGQPADDYSKNNNDDIKSYQSYSNRSPANGKVICQIQSPTTTQINNAVESSHFEFQNGKWAKMSSAQRGSVLRAMADKIRQNIKELSYIEAMDSGIPITQIQNNHIPYAIDTLEYYAALATKGFDGRIVDTPHAGGHEDSFAYTRREPLGVCVGLGAWNYPLVNMVWKLAPALACGNTFIYKPSECTPMTSLAVAKLWQDILPPAVLQVILGNTEHNQQIIQQQQQNVGSLLVEHPLIAKVSLTGSTETGIKVARSGADTLKRLTLELGGKSPLIVFPDANLQNAVQVAIEGNFINNGQVCSNCTRVFVHSTILNEFQKLLLARLQDCIKIGDPMMETTNIGPMMIMPPPNNPQKHYNHVMGFIERNQNDPNVTMIFGGTGFEQNGGYYINPTVMICQCDDVEIVQQEIFGPVMTILPFDTEEEVIQRANASQYGLAAGVMTNNLMLAHRMAKSLHAGNIWINNWNLSPVEMPFGPYKMSGYGKELGIEALDHYTQTKMVYVEMGNATDSSSYF